MTGQTREALLLAIAALERIDHATIGERFKAADGLRSILATAAQAQSEPLTREQILAAVGAPDDTPNGLLYEGVARAIERAHGITKD